jgi:POT family proton-dependent oligopeptide transporter
MNIVILLGVLVTVATGIPVFMQLRKHPKGLFVLFFAEMWERFSYYGMRGLLIFYLTQHFLFDDKFASGQYGSYTTLVYLLPLIGGILADRYLGTRKAIAFGALLLVAGHLTMAIEGPPARQVLTYQGAAYEFQVEGRGGGREVTLRVGDKTYPYKASEDGGLTVQGLPPGGQLPSVLPKGSFEMSVTGRDQGYVNIFYLALSLIVMGVGFLKPNISSIVGQLYPQGDPRRDPGFTLYYYGINLGAFWAAVLCGWLGQSFGWWAGFGLAGVGMLLGFVAFVLGKPLLQGKGEPPDPVKLKASVVGPLNREGIIYLGALLGLIVVFFVVQKNSLVGWALGIGSLAVLTYVGVYIFRFCNKVERERLFLALTLIAGSVVFFTLFEQAGSSLNLFADRNVNLDLISAAHVIPGVLGRDLFLGSQAMLAASGRDPASVWFVDMGFTAAQAQSFNAGYILIFAPVFAAVWGWLARIGRDPPPLMKFGLGLAQVGLGFLIVVWSQGLADSAFRMPLFILGLVYLLHTTGELFLSPVGLSEVTKLAPPVLVATMMAVWFLASSAAQYIGGFIAQMAGTETVGGQVLNPAGALATSVGVFNVIGWVGVGFGVLFLLLSLVISKWSHGVNDASNHPATEIDGERQAMPH